MKMQIAFRETPARRHGHNVTMAFGVIDVGPSEIRNVDSMSLAFRFDYVQSLDHAVAVSVAGAPRNVKDQWDEAAGILKYSSLENMFVHPVDRAIPNETHNADFIFRETELPSCQLYGKVYAFAGIVQTKPDQEFNFRDILWFENISPAPDWEMNFTGRTGKERRPETGPVDMVERMRGNAPGAFFTEPVWGFLDEPYALPGTMSLDTYRKCERYHELVLADDLDADEDEEMRELRPFMKKAGFDMIERDDTFKTFVRKTRELQPDLKAHRPMTASQVALREETSREAMRLAWDEQEDAADQCRP